MDKGQTILIRLLNRFHRSVPSMFPLLSLERTREKVGFEFESEELQEKEEEEDAGLERDCIPHWMQRANFSF